MRHLTALTVLVCAAPLTASAKPIGTFQFIVADPGDQTRPSIDGQYVVYAGPGPAGSGSDVFLYNVLSGTKQTIAGGVGDQDSPDVFASTAVYRDSNPASQGIWIRFWQTDVVLRAPNGDGPVSSPTIAASVAAWEKGTAGSRNIVVSRFGAGEEYVLGTPNGGPAVGDQHGPAAYDSLVAYIDEHDQGAAWVHDSATKTSARVCGGDVKSIALGDDGTGVFAAVARATQAHDDDIEIYDLSGQLVNSLPVVGVQRNPHISADWIAFEDVSTQFSQVVLWNWKTNLIFVPHPSATQQTLNDISFIAPGQVRVVFEDASSPETGRDIALYTLDVNPISYDGDPNGWPIHPPPPAGATGASCDDPQATVLATLDLPRENGRPQAGSTTFHPASAAPVLVCVDATRVSSAWLTLDDAAIATPSDFNPGVVHLEVHGSVGADSARISGVIAGKPGAHLHVRVLAADPAAAGASPQLAGAAGSGGGCGSAGASGPVSLSMLAVLLFRRRKARST